MRNFFCESASRLFSIDVIAIALMLVFVPVIAASDGTREAGVAFSEGRAVSGADGNGKVPGLQSANQLKLRSSVAQNINGAFRIYDAQVSLYYDDDRDNHYYGIDVLFDADTDYFDAEVYALLYLSLEGGPWEHYYTTDYFRIYGASGVDDYLVETELFSGYPTGYYDVLIELYDESGYMVAKLGPEDTSALSILPLEDQQNDAPPFLYVDSVSGSRGGGGAAGLISLFLLTTVLVLRRRNAA